MAAKRSRTGCQTCRSRKLKCDEVKPICGHCAKSNRECIRSDGIAFRHEQNPSMNAQILDPDRKLKNFFDYRETYSAEDLKSFWPTKPIASKLQWITIENPYDETQNPSNPGTNIASYQQVASHSLEALSTAATDHPAYPTPSFDAYAGLFAGPNNGRTGYGPAMHGQNHQSNGINFLLNPSNTPANLIDPNLEGASEEGIGHPTDSELNKVQSDQHDDQEKPVEQKAEESEEQLAYVLRNFSGEEPAG